MTKTLSSTKEERELLKVWRAEIASAPKRTECEADAFRTGMQHQGQKGKLDAITEQKCQKCGELTHSEEAWINGEIWCHPCADKWH